MNNLVTAHRHAVEAVRNLIDARRMHPWLVIHLQHVARSLENVEDVIRSIQEPPDDLMRGPVSLDEATLGGVTDDAATGYRGGAAAVPVGAAV